jgi:ribosomal protein S18 acetylase RimI-like enzyme
MVRLDRPTQEEFDRWLELSAQRQAEDRAWVNGTDAAAERAQVNLMIPILLPAGLESPDHAFRVARAESGEELGFVWVGTLPDAPPGTCLLFDLFVHESHRGRRVGRAILEQMLDLLRADHIDTVLLYVRADNAPARALYTHLGFVAVDSSEGARDLQMRKTLEPDPLATRTVTLERQHVALGDLPGDGWILDIGGGGEGVIGRVAGTRVVAIDRLKTELVDAPDGPLKIVMDARDLQFPDAMFAAATAFYSFLYMRDEDLPKVFAEAARVLAPDGQLLVWDTALPPRSEEAKDLVLVPITVTLPDGQQISTGYGSPWPAAGRDASHYARLAAAAGLREIRAQQIGHHLALELAKP